MQSRANDIASVLRAVPHFAAARRLQWVPLPGGSSNRLVKVTADGAVYAVRLPDHREADDPRLGIHDEWRLLKALGGRGITPPPVWHDPQSGLLVTRFHSGPVWTRQRLLDRREWPALVAMLQRVHDTSIALPAFQPVVAARRYWAQYVRAAKPAPAALRAWRGFEAEQHMLEGALQPAGLCHNDVMFSNLVGDPPLLLDWEYAAYSDPLFDLATVIVYHGLSVSQADALLGLYLGRGDAPARRRLGMLCRLCQYLSGFWALARSGEFPAGREGLVTLPSRWL